MGLKLEYDSFVKRLNRATVAVLAVALSVPAALAQSKGTPASVTSTGFGGSTGPRGTAASVTSTGFGGSAGPRGTAASVTSTGFGAQSHRAPAMPPSLASPGFHRSNPGLSSHPGQLSHHPQPPHHPQRGASHHGGDRHPRRGAIYAVPYYYPYAYDAGGYEQSEPAAAEAPIEEQEQEEEYLGGPTIFDRRGPGTSRPVEDGYVDHAAAQPAPAVQAPAVQEGKAAEAEAVSNQPDTLLIFKDGHQLEVSNYAIVGTTLFDLSDGHRHKIPLSELNLTATSKENDDRGIDFRLPLGGEAE